MTRITDPFERVRDLSRRVMEDARYVRISDEEVEYWGERIGEMGEADSWPSLEMSDEDMAAYELAASAVNYCYWHGRGSVRPGGASSRLMYRLLAQAYATADDWSTRIESFARSMRQAGFPLADRRSAHLLELLAPMVEGHTLESFAAELVQLDVRTAVERVVCAYPGYASDPFLKRAFLFALQMNRRSGWGEVGIADVPVPADYQIPKVLRHLGVIHYNAKLTARVERERPISSGSAMETEIRAATVVAGDRLAKRSGRTPAEIDTFLWLGRRQTNAPFHLTVTTAY